MHLTTPAVNVLLATLIPTITIAQAVIQVIVLMVTPAQPLKSALVAQDQVLVTNAIQIRTAMYLLNLAHTVVLLITLVTDASLANPLPNLLKHGENILNQMFLLIFAINYKELQWDAKKVSSKDIIK